MAMNKSIFDQEVFDVGDTCLALASSVDKPHYYVRFKVQVVKRKMQADKAIYYCKILAIEEQKHIIQQYVHNMQYRVHHFHAERGHIKRFKCFDLLDDEQTFDQNFSERYSTQLLVVPNILVSSTYDGIDSILANTAKILLAQFDENSQELSKRIETITS